MDYLGRKYVLTNRDVKKFCSLLFQLIKHPTLYMLHLYCCLLQLLSVLGTSFQIFHLIFHFTQNMKLAIVKMLKTCERLNKKLGHLNSRCRTLSTTGRCYWCALCLQSPKLVFTITQNYFISYFMFKEVCRSHSVSYSYESYIFRTTCSIGI